MSLFNKDDTKTKQQIVLLATEIDRLHKRLDDLDQKIRSVRGLVNRKLKIDEDTETQDLNTPFSKTFL